MVVLVLQGVGVVTLPVIWHSIVQIIPLAFAGIRIIAVYSGKQEIKRIDGRVATQKDRISAMINNAAALQPKVNALPKEYRADAAKALKQVMEGLRYIIFKGHLRTFDDGGEAKYNGKDGYISLKSGHFIYNVYIPALPLYPSCQNHPKNKKKPVISDWFMVHLQRLELLTSTMRVSRAILKTAINPSQAGDDPVGQFR